MNLGLKAKQMVRLTLSPSSRIADFGLADFDKYFDFREEYFAITAENGYSEDLPFSQVQIPTARFVGSCFCERPRERESTPSSNNTKSSPPTCATSWSPQQPRRFPAEEGIGPSPGRARAVPRHHRPLRRLSGAMLNVHVDFRCCNASPCRSPSARFAIPASRSTTRASSASSRCSCTAAVTSAAGPPGKSTFHVSERAYGPNQLRYDLRKLKGHGLLQRDGSRYAYRLTPKGVQVALLFLFFHKRLCGPLAHSRFHHRPVARHRPPSKLETAYHHADKAIQQIVDLLAA